MRETMEEHLETLSALLDGAPVAIDALEAALADGEARRGLVEFVRLRQAARDDGARPVSGFAEGVRRSLRRQRRLARMRVPLPLAAAAVVLALIGGSLIEVKWPAPTPDDIRPPQPSRVLKFDAPPQTLGDGGR
jgi:hypothetical protein